MTAPTNQQSSLGTALPLEKPMEEGQLLFSLRPDDRRRLVVRIESKNHSGEIWEPSTNQTNIKADEQTTTGVGIAQSVRPRD